MEHAAPLTRHLYVHADKAAMSQGQEQGWEPCAWIGLNAVPHRAWGCTVLLQCGALYRNLPLSALAVGEIGFEQKWKTADAQRWDCFGINFTTLIYPALEELDVSVWLPTRQHWMGGSYLFTAEFYGDSYSMEPSQTKAHHFIELSNGRIGCYPGNNILWHEISFTRVSCQKPAWLKVQTDVHACEEAPFDDVVREDSA